MEVFYNIFWPNNQFKLHSNDLATAKLTIMETDKNSVSQNLFENTTFEYMDLITSAYEIGLVSSEVINEVAALEELWNPGKKQPPFDRQVRGWDANLQIPDGDQPHLARVIEWNDLTISTGISTGISMRVVACRIGKSWRKRGKHEKNAFRSKHVSLI